MSVWPTLHQIQWREPLWLVLAVMPIFLWVLRRNTRLRRNAAYADPALLPWVLRHDDGEQRTWRWLRGISALLVWPLLAIAMAGPRLPLHTPGEEAHDGVDIMVVLDVSRSMAAADIMPDRFQRARIELQELLPRLRGDRLGIVLFGGQPQLFVPLTYDRHAVSDYLTGLNPQLLPFAGSNLAAALGDAGTLLDHSTRSAKAVLVLSDGDTGTDGKAAAKAAAQLRAQGIRVYALGIGSVEGAGIALPGGGWLKHDDRPVITRMNELLLRHVAEAGGGRYARASDNGSDWDQLYDAGMGRLAKHGLTAEAARRMSWRELFPWALIPALVLLLAAWLPVRGSAATAMVWLPVFLLVAAGTARAGDLTTRAYAAYAHKDYATAASLYQRVPGYAGRMGEGACAYRQENFTAAVTAYSRAVLAAGNDTQRADALFDLGNSYFNRGDYAQAKAIYADVLRYRPDDQAARRNGVLAEILRKAVAQEQHAHPRRNRGSRGRYTQHPESPDFNLGTGHMGLGKETQPKGAGTAPNAIEGGADMAALIARGVARARTAQSGGADAGSGAAGQDHAQSLLAARARMERLQEQDATMWKSLFELEEGFPAALTHPRAVPGVAPW